MAFDPMESPFLTEIIAGTSPTPDSVTISTTCVPDFHEDGFKAAGTAYHVLGSLSQIYHAVANQSIQHSATCTSGEVCPYDFFAGIYQAVGGNGSLELEAESIDGLAFLFVEEVCAASANQDFTQLLCHRHHFRVLKPDGSISSFSSGLEKETIFAALNLFLTNSGWRCQPTDKDRLSLTITMPRRLASTISLHRLEELRVFGALIALALISGKPPGAVSPALLQYVLNDYNLDALTPSFVASWHLELEQAARQIQSLGQDRDLAPFQRLFINHLNIQLYDSRELNFRFSPSLQRFCIAIRTSTTCWSSNWCMQLRLGQIYLGIPKSMPLVAGLTFPVQTASLLERGTEFYLVHAWTSFISNFQSLQPYLMVTNPTLIKLVSHFSTAANGLDTEAIFYAFLQHTGNPCTPALFEGAKVHFHPDVIDRLSEIHSPAFRPRMLCWVATGSPFLEPNAAQIDTIHIDLSFLMTLTTVIICSRMTRIPISRLIELHQTTYPNADNTTFEDAVDSWLLLQLLNGIGKLSML
ncbi:hypothetical protein B0H17DRAFT_1139677 [Mycena rosella]|uniref:Uncharacterized protein n=1 Tax=Mycena rosella TaxID=1033263 RepID=A0AAD7D7A9_MYCRO|nr:hypothetical protein B0H17DRAFT_1139677 [Mycena rosella]